LRVLTITAVAGALAAAAGCSAGGESVTHGETLTQPDFTVRLAPGVVSSGNEDMAREYCPICPVGQSTMRSWTDASGPTTLTIKAADMTARPLFSSTRPPDLTTYRWMAAQVATNGFAVTSANWSRLSGREAYEVRLRNSQGASEITRLLGVGQRLYVLSYRSNSADMSAANQFFDSFALVGGTTPTEAASGSSYTPPEGDFTTVFGGTPIVTRKGDLRSYLESEAPRTFTVVVVDPAPEAPLQPDLAYYRGQLETAGINFAKAVPVEVDGVAGVEVPIASPNGDPGVLRMAAVGSRQYLLTYYYQPGFGSLEEASKFFAGFRFAKKN
jgi:hypothetical protein